MGGKSIFPLEVGARRYCGSSVKSCFSRLGFSSKLIRSLIKSLSIASISSSFYIWQSRESKTWNNPEIPKPSSGPSNKAQTKEYKQTPQKISKLQPSNKVAKATLASQVFNVGLINKGNTCYLNASLQCLSVFPELWSVFSSDSLNRTPFVSAFVKIMSLLKTSKSPVDPSQLLRFLKQVLIRSGRPEFDLYQQQDACEILSCVLNELCRESVPALNCVNMYVKNTVTCNSCLLSIIQISGINWMITNFLV